MTDYFAVGILLMILMWIIPFTLELLGMIEAQLDKECKEDVPIYGTHYDCDGVMCSCRLEFDFGTVKWTPGNLTMFGESVCKLHNTSFVKVEKIISPYEGIHVVCKGKEIEVEE